MKFKLMDYFAVAVYAPTPSDFYATHNEWYNAGDIIHVDFENVVESIFISDYLKGHFTTVDTKAERWANSINESVEQKG